MSIHQTGTVSIKRCHFYVLVREVSVKTKGGIFGLTHPQDDVTLTFAFTAKENAEKAAAGWEEKRQEAFRVATVEDRPFLRSVLPPQARLDPTHHEVRPSAAKPRLAYDLLMLDGMPLPLTQKGAQWLSEDPGFPGDPPDPVVCRKAWVTPEAWADAVQKDTWGALMTTSMLWVMGEDPSLIDWEDQLGLAEIGSGLGKTWVMDNQWPGEA
jgi:hypothetical protein